MNNSKEELTKDFNKVTTVIWHKNFKEKSVSWEEYNINNDLIFSAFIKRNIINTLKNEYDEKGNEIHQKDSKGFESWHQYDEKGNCIYYKDTQGYEKWREYDEKGNLIHYKDSKGYESWTEYDEKGNEIHYKNSKKFESWTEYDEKGNEIYYKDSRKTKISTEYDEKGNVIYKNHNGYKRWYEYDEKGNEIHYKDSSNSQTWHEYNEKENIVIYKTDNGFISWTEYDEKGNEIYYKNSDGIKRLREYDENGNEIHFKDSNGQEELREYDENGNLILYKDIYNNRCYIEKNYINKESYKQEKIIKFNEPIEIIETTNCKDLNILTNNIDLGQKLLIEITDNKIFPKKFTKTYEKEKLEILFTNSNIPETNIFTITSNSTKSNEKLFNIYYAKNPNEKNVLLNDSIKDFDEAKIQLLKYANMKKYENLFSLEQSYNKNSNIETTLKNFKKQSIELCSKDNPSLKLTMFIKDLVKDFSNEEKALLFTDTINNITKELNKINTNTKENAQTNTQKKGRK